ncbi:hypothetical protein FACS1894151_05380 [Spirochaetia bacterium]|nr:hypothetical protein FACS1894151_05380 [Spirochaetia bacterium]
MQDVFDALGAAGFSAVLRGFSAIDRYLNYPPLPVLFLETSADISDLARLFGELRFPGVDLADAALDCGETSVYFRCTDIDERVPLWNGASCRLLSFGWNSANGHFLDPHDVYPQLAAIYRHELYTETQTAPEINPLLEFNPSADSYTALMDAALIFARYGASLVNSCGNFIEGNLTREFSALMRPSKIQPKTEAQRMLLSCILVSERPDLALELLKSAGFVAEFWPELSELDDVDHSKEFHPEGNGWNHTLETFRYRKSQNGKNFSLLLSLGLLLHDTGKPIAAISGGRRFNGHAELGAFTARRFLERLGFDSNLISGVCYLVKNHMLPAALPRLPLQRTEEIMASALFPTLMELYRCDESSSFKGMDGYYESSAAYRSYLKHRRNPYRSPDGKLQTRPE